MGRRKAANEVPAGTVQLDGGAADGTGDEVVATEETPAPRGRRRAQTAPEDGAVGEDDFMHAQAEADRADTKARHVDDGLEAALEMVNRMRKGLAYAAAVHDLDVKLTVLNEIADTAASVAEDARRALRDAKAEKRNLQPAG